MPVFHPTIGREGETATLLKTSSVLFQLVRWLRQLNRSTQVNNEYQKRPFMVLSFWLSLKY